MADVKIFTIGGQDIHVKDEIARTNASSAVSTANQAKTTADAAKLAVDEIAALSRIEISYSEEDEKITITTGNHKG